ncbi:MAG: hypothetical protein F9K46_09520, partial [Anaerolineae bacterium]
MIRSLLAPRANAQTKSTDEETTEAPVIKRNLTRENLEAALEDEILVWLDFVDPDTEEIHWLQQTFKLHPIVVADLQREDRRPTLVVYPEYMFLSLFQPQMSVGQVKGEEIHCIIGTEFFLTIRKANSTAIEGVYNRVAQNEEAWGRGTIYFLYLVIQAVIDSYYPLLDRISVLLFELEEKTLSNGEGKIAQKSVYRIKQQLIALRQMISPQREVLSNVIGEHRISQSPANRDLFAHLYERLLRIYDVIDAQRDLSNNV